MDSFEERGLPSIPVVVPIATVLRPLVGVLSDALAVEFFLTLVLHLEASGRKRLEIKVKISLYGGSCYLYSHMAVLLEVMESSLASAFNPTE
ncbi:hypothetical protein L1887_23129 [Cichorium endivia]|nr:hypothetical protein L1887_23129 [Cichorium endivia]